MRLKKLRQAKADAVAKGKAITGKATAEDRSLTPEERETHKALLAEIAALDAEIETYETQMDAERSLESSTTFGRDRTDPRTRATTAAQRSVARGRDGGFRNLGEFALAVRNACSPAGAVDPRLISGQISGAPSNFEQESGSASGEGYLAPPELLADVWSLVFSGDDLLPDVAPSPTSANQVEYIGDETTPWGATGIQANWRIEGSQMNPTKLLQNGRAYKINELYAFVLATNEMLADVPRLNDRITVKSADAIRWKASEAVMFGDGVGKPLGWASPKNPGRVVVAKDGGQATGTISVDNVTRMFASLLSLPGGSPRWYANRDIVPQLVKLIIGQQPVWTQPVGGLRDAPGGYLLGLPIYWNEHCSSLSTEGDLQLVDVKGYMASVNGGMEYATSMHLYFDYNIGAFRWTVRLGGQPAISAPVTPAKSALPKSPFVLLQTR